MRLAPLLAVLAAGCVSAPSPARPAGPVTLVVEIFGME